MSAAAAADLDQRTESAAADADEEEKDENSERRRTFVAADAAERSVRAPLADDSIRRHLVEQKILE